MTEQHVSFSNKKERVKSKNTGVFAIGMNNVASLCLIDPFLGRVLTMDAQTPNQES